MMGTYEQAIKNAERWLHIMIESGITDVSIVHHERDPFDSNWLFVFRHELTGCTCKLFIHGLTDDEAAKVIMPPKTYWCGSSTAEPALSNFLKDGFTIRIVEA
jgi:hypothetical protein